MREDGEVRSIEFPKDLFRQINESRKKSKRTFGAEVRYLVEVSLRQAQDSSLESRVAVLEKEMNLNKTKIEKRKKIGKGAA